MLVKMSLKYDALFCLKYFPRIKSWPWRQISIKREKNYCRDYYRRIYAIYCKSVYSQYISKNELRLPGRYTENELCILYKKSTSSLPYL